MATQRGTSLSYPLQMMPVMTQKDDEDEKHSHPPPSPHAQDQLHVL